jgi:hypothetical protein
MPGIDTDPDGMPLTPIPIRQNDANPAQSGFPDPQSTIKIILDFFISSAKIAK